MTKILGKSIEVKNLIPDLDIPEPNEAGKLYCKYCTVYYPNVSQFNEHLKTKKKCKAIRVSLGIPVLEDRKWFCKKCNKEYATKYYHQEHEFNCRANQKLIVKPFCESIPEED